MIKKILLGKNLFIPALTLCTVFTTYFVIKQELREIYGFVAQLIAFSTILVIHKLFITSFTSTELSIKRHNWLLLGWNIVISIIQFWLAWNIVRVITTSTYLRDALIFLSISATLAFVQNIFIKNSRFQYGNILQIITYSILTLLLHYNIFTGDSRLYSLFIQATGIIVILFETFLLFVLAQFYIESHKSLDKS
jgi:hypothetical protein